MAVAPIESLVTWALALVGALVGSYLGAYLKKKGENLATREDVDKLLVQVRAVTTTTKEIETKISNEVWNRQRRWELKRDVLLEGTKKLSACLDAWTQLHLAYQEADQHRIGLGQTAYERIVKKTAEWEDISREFLTTTLFQFRLVCGTEVIEALHQLDLTTHKVADDLRGNPKAFSESADEFKVKLRAVLDALRKEIDPA